MGITFFPYLHNDGDDNNIWQYGKKLSVLAHLRRGNLNEKIPSIDWPVGKPLAKPFLN